MLSSLSRSIRLLFLLPTTLTALVLASAIVEGVNAQTKENPEIILRADTQEVDHDTEMITARGNVWFTYPSAQMQGTAKQAHYFAGEPRLVLIGDVHLLQRGESLRGEKVTCLIESGQCTVNAPIVLPQPFLISEDDICGHDPINAPAKVRKTDERGNLKLLNKHLQTVS